jgi:gliding motility-associated-like protein
MKKLYFIIVVIAVFSNCVNAQTNWLQSIGGSSQDEVNDIKIDNSGNIYSVGYFNSNANFGNSLQSLVALNGNDIFVQKISPSGQVIWVKRFGGTANDRGLKISLGITNEIFITGTYSGTIEFGNTTLTSVENSIDVFLAKLDVNGEVLWANSIGGSYGDLVYGLAVDGANSPVITGQYKGTAIFGSDTLTSTLDTSGLAFSYDIFVVKYSSAGLISWLKNGGSPFDNRGMSLAIDQNNNIFVTGQYSDTLDFDNTIYPSPDRNVGFLLKLSNDGLIQWFQRLRASNVTPNDIKIDNQNNLVLTGDFAGNLWFPLPENYILTSNYSRRIFVAKFTNDGNLIWARAESSERNVSAKNIAVAPNNSVYVIGDFKCTFNTLCDTYGQGIFNSLGFSDVYVLSLESNGNRTYAKHFAGPREDRGKSIAINNLGIPVFAGSFDEKFILPTMGDFSVLSSFNNLGQVLYSPNSNVSNFCGAINYGTYQYTLSRGNSDGFIVSGIDTARSLFDYYDRRINPLDCSKPKIYPCITHWDSSASAQINCLSDTLVICERDSFSLKTNTGLHGKVSPYQNMYWNNNVLSSQSDYFTITNSGSYPYEVSSIDGCYSYLDTVVAIVNPKPPKPLIADNIGVNQIPTQLPIDIEICIPPTSFQLFGYSSEPSDSIYWYYYQSIFNSDTITASVYNPVNTYKLIEVNSFNCTKETTIRVVFDSIPPVLSLNSVVPDTLVVCEGDYFIYHVFDDFTNPSGAVLCDNSYTVNWQISPFAQISQTQSFCQSILMPNNLVKIYPTQTGNYTLNISGTKSNACGTAQSTITRNHFIQVLPNFQITPTAVNDTLFVCPSQSFQLSVDSQFPANWIVPGGFFTDSVSISNSNFGKHLALYPTIEYSNFQQYCRDSIVVSPIRSPEVFRFPENGLICPFDSVKLFVELLGINYQWYGPTGQISTNSSFIHVTIPGFYYCEITKPDGCLITTLQAEVKQYSSPYIIANPTNVICNGGTTSIEVQTNEPPLLVWALPLSGNSLSQEITQPGLYSCSATLCQITTVLNIEINEFQSSVSILGPDTFNICPNAEFSLTAESGLFDYVWSNGSNLQSTTIDDEGIYSVMIIDQNGCTANSENVLINYLPLPLEPTVTNDTICPGNSALLIANSSLNLNWFVSNTTSTILSTNDSLSIEQVFLQTSFYVASVSVDNCLSNLVEAIVFISPNAQQSQIQGSGVICNSLPPSLSILNLEYDSILWNGPNNFQSNDTAIVANEPGIYTLYLSQANCNFFPDSIVVISASVEQPIISSIPDFCIGDSIQLFASNNLSNPIVNWVHNNQNIQSNPLNIINSTASDTGAYNVVVSDINGCSNSTIINLSPLPSVEDPATQSIIVCSGSPGTFQMNNANTINWFETNSSTDLLFSGATFTTPILLQNTSYFIQAISNNLCPSQKIEVFADIYIPQLLPQISGNDTICNSTPIQLISNATVSNIALWTGPNNFSSNELQILVNVGGMYTLSLYENSCLSGIDSIEVTQINLSINVANQIENICSGNTLTLEASSNNSDAQYNWNYSSVNTNVNPFIITDVTENNAGIYSVFANIGTCVSDSINVAVIVNQTPPTPVLLSSNTYCLGDSLILNVSPEGNCTWSGPNNFTSNQFYNALFSTNNSLEGIYSVFYTYPTTGCIGNSTIINVSAIPLPIFSLGNDTTICVEDSVALSPNSTFSNYLWSNGSTSSNLYVSNSGEYSLLVTDQYGCSSSDSISLIVLNCNLVIGNVFTPNGDLLNESFLSNGEGLQTFNLKVFDRWGKQVFESNSVSNFWQGKTSSGQECDQGTYFYVIDATDIKNRNGQWQGYVTLFR